MRELSKAEVFAAIADIGHAAVARALGRTEEFVREELEDGFQGARSKWRQAYIRDLINGDGESAGRVWLRGPECGCNILLNDLAGQWASQRKLDVQSAFFVTRMNGGGKWEITNPATIEEWTESFVDNLRNPLASRERALQRNALAIYQAALNGNVRFFERVSEVFRKRKRVNGRRAGGSAGEILLQFWIPAGLWKLSAREGRERVNGIVAGMKACNLTDAASQVVKMAAGILTAKAYEKAKQRLGL